MHMTTLSRTLLLVCVAGGLAGESALAQGFDSGSDGSDGALTIGADLGEVVFDPASYTPPLDPDGDGVYHFTTITIGANTTVKLTSSVLGEGRPVVWLASGDVIVAGTIDASGEAGPNSGSPLVPAAAGAGGYAGGVGNDVSSHSTYGNGPGGGAAYTLSLVGGNNIHGGGGSYGSPGGSGSLVGTAPLYGNAYLLPMVGGSGGGGGYHNNGTSVGGGGGGGGALVIASNTQIAIDGTIRANGGNGSTSGFAVGGGGSGGAIRLIAPRLLGSGTLSALGGSGVGANAGGLGRIRLEGFRREGPTSVTPAPSVASPGLVFLPPTAPLVRLISVDGVAVAADPTGSFVVPDAVVTAAGEVTLAIAAQNIPLGTVLKLTLRPETGAPVTVDTTALSGTLESSTATATVTLSAGFTRLFLQANWTP